MTAQRTNNSSGAGTSSSPALLPAVVTLTVANHPPAGSSCGIRIGRTVSAVSGNPAGVRIASLDPAVFGDNASDAAADADDDDRPRVGDEIVSINGVDPQSSVDRAMQLLADAKEGDAVTLRILRTNALEYRRGLIFSRYGNEYRIEMESPTRATLKPKTNPSLLKATLAPMYYTRFKYRITFDDRTGAVAFEDCYAITFNRSNGATPEQQRRIQDRNRAFRDQLDRMEATMEHHREEARKLALLSSSSA
jgi:hypothetical protein